MKQIEADFGDKQWLVKKIDQDVRAGLNLSNFACVRRFFIEVIYLLKDERFNRRVYVVGKIPTVRDVCAFAGKLGYTVELTLSASTNCAEQKVLTHLFVQAYDCDQLFDRDKFIHLVRKLNCFGIKDLYHRDLIEEKLALLRLFNNPRFSPRWHHLTKFVLLCGYKMECRLVPRKNEPSACFPPSNKMETVVDTRDEHQKLLDRLNYPM